ncbi:MAG: DUF1640 domain-containing protein [bacterium]|nr:DUF1640 domain-containing protein [bacterium]
MPASEPIDEKVRWALMRRLIEVLGEEEAETLMESLPPVVWSQLATKDDLGALEKRLMSAMDTRFSEFKSEIRNEFSEFKSEIRNEFSEFKSEIRNEFSEFKSEIRNEFTEFKSEIKSEFTEFKSEIRGELTEFRIELADQKGEWKTELARSTRTVVLSFVGVAVAMLGAMVALAQAGALAA